MINDPNYNLPKDAFIRLFDNPIPAGDPARAEAPEWAQELDEVVVWAHMSDNGQVSVKVNGEDIGGGGGGGFQTATLTLTGDDLPDIPTIIEGPNGDQIIANLRPEGDTATIPVPVLVMLAPGQSLVSISGSYYEEDGAYVITGDCTLNVTSGGD